MGLRYYDESLHKLISGWVNNPKHKIKVLKPDETAALFAINADINDDKPLTLPLIALSRNNNIEILQTKKTLLSFDGKHLKSDEKNTIQLNAIPIQLSYQIDIYTKTYDEAYSYVREFVFGIINNPTLSITIPYNGIDLKSQANMRILSTITDNSDIPERLFRDQFARLTIQIELQDAYFFSVPINTNAHIEIDEGDPLPPSEQTTSGELHVMNFDRTQIDSIEKL